MKRILLTGARAPVTLDLMRHFHCSGHEVYLADSIHLPLARLSRFAKRFFVVSKPVHSPSQFVQDLANIARKNQIDLVVPTCEEIFYVSSRIELFPDHTNVFAEPLPKLELLHNKWKFVQLVSNLGISVHAPETHLVASQQELSSWIAHPQLTDWVFKPVYSRFAARTLVGPTSQEIAKLCPTEVDPWVVQRRIVGQEFSTYSLAHQGKLRAHACYRSKYRAGLGSGIYFLTVDDARIRGFVQAFVAQQNFTGQLGFDLMQSKDGNLYVLECNPRATSGLHMLALEPLASAFLDSSGPLLEPTSITPAMLASVMLLFPLPQTLRRGGFLTLFKDMLAARDVMFAWNDPMPALLSPLSILEVLVTACRTRKRLTRAATFDIEWNGEPM
jgi:predicted ATP-grasp superfamily ATP-dependent carboligase